MATYIALLKWTDQGIKDIKQSPSRLDAAKQAFASAGGQLKAFTEDEYRRVIGSIP